MTAGIDKLKATLEAEGFRTSPNPLRERYNESDWHAYRRTRIESRECECNTGRPIQLIVMPYSIEAQDRRHESVTVEVCGEHGGVWFKLQAYSLSVGGLPAALPRIEAQLIAAWNALGEPTP